MKCKFYSDESGKCLFDGPPDDCPFEDNEYNCVCFEPRKTETYVKQIITDPIELAAVINKIGYENVLNIIPCNSYDGCIVVILYKEIKNNE